MTTMKDFMKQRRKAGGNGQPDPASKSAAAAANPAADKPAAGEPPPQPKQPRKSRMLVITTREADPAQTITYSCGHKVGCRYLQGDKCPACLKRQQRQRNRAKHQAQAEAKAQAGAAASRLPDGATFTATYDANTQLWIGTLTTAGQVFEAEHSAVFRLMAALDALYRQTLQGVNDAT
jgi:hypothetical protein